MGRGAAGPRGSGEPLVRFDVRSKVVVLIAMNAVLFLSTDLALEVTLMAVAAAMVALGGRGRMALGLLAAFAALVLVELALVPRIAGFAGGLVMFVAVLVRKILPVLAVGLWIVATTQVSELLAVAEKLRLPRNVTIPLSVAFRFFPTLREEYASVRDAMRMRGIGLSIEHVLVPLMMSAATVSDELSAAALCRGIDAPHPRSSLGEHRLAAADVAAIGGSCALVATLCGAKAVGAL